MIPFIKNNCFIIAELSANHNGDLAIAIETIKAAKRAGAIGKRGQWGGYLPSNKAKQRL